MDEPLLASPAEQQIYNRLGMRYAIGAGMLTAVGYASTKAGETIEVVLSLQNLDALTYQQLSPYFSNFMLALLTEIAVQQQVAISFDN